MFSVVSPKWDIGFCVDIGSIPSPGCRASMLQAREVAEAGLSIQMALDCCRAHPLILTVNLTGLRNT